MTIEQEAREREAQKLHNICAEEIGAQSRKDHLHTRDDDCVIRSICRALEQRDAERQAHANFRQRVSDAMEAVLAEAIKSGTGASERAAIIHPIASPFINPKPVDPRITAMRKMLAARGITDPRDDVLADDFARLEAELNALGLVVREEV